MNRREKMIRLGSDIHAMRVALAEKEARLRTLEADFDKLLPEAQREKAQDDLSCNG